MRMRDAGLIYRWTKQFRPNPHQCIVQKNELSDFAQLPLKALHGCFYCLFLGWALAAFVFLLEYFIKSLTPF